MGIIENAKEIAELVKKYNDQELYQRIVDLRTEILDLREENLALREKLKALEQSVSISKELKRDGNAYYLGQPDGSPLGPYCMACWDYDRKLVNLTLTKSTIQNRVYTTQFCPICAARKKKRSDVFVFSGCQ